MDEAGVMTLWQTVEQLARQLPFTRERIEAVLSTELTPRRQSLATDFYESKAIPLAGGMVIEGVDLRLSRAGKTPGFLLLPLKGAYVSLAQVRRQYGDLPLTDSPMGHSVMEKHVYTASLPRMNVGFGFQGGAPGLLGERQLSSEKEHGLGAPDG